MDIQSLLLYWVLDFLLTVSLELLWQLIGRDITYVRIRCTYGLW